MGDAVVEESGRHRGEEGEAMTAGLPEGFIGYLGWLRGELYSICQSLDKTLWDISDAPKEIDSAVVNDVVDIWHGVGDMADMATRMEEKWKRIVEEGR